MVTYMEDTKMTIKNMIFAAVLSLGLLGCDDGDIPQGQIPDAAVQEPDSSGFTQVDLPPMVDVETLVDIRTIVDAKPVVDSAPTCLPGTHSIGVIGGLLYCVLDQPDADPNADPCGPLASLDHTLDSGIYMCGPLKTDGGIDH
jgi:hypothetical protein